MVILFVIFIAIVSITGTGYSCCRAIENNNPKWYDIAGVFCSILELIILGNLLVLWILK